MPHHSRRASIPTTPREGPPLANPVLILIREFIGTRAAARTPGAAYRSVAKVAAAGIRARALPGVKGTRYPRGDTERVAGQYTRNGSPAGPAPQIGAARTRAR